MVACPAALDLPHALVELVTMLIVVHEPVCDIGVAAGQVSGA
nr:hypothetical protein [Streptomyces davaonensis]